MESCFTDTVESKTDTALKRAYFALAWKALTHTRWDDFVIAPAAGNEADVEATSIYPGFGRADYTTEMAITRLPDLLFTWVQDANLWSPTTGAGGFPTFAASIDEAVLLEQDIVSLGFDTIPAAENVLVVGSVNDQFEDSTFSETGADVKAVGQSICADTTCSGLVRGTSYAAPQVTALAAYLWNLSPELRGRPAAETVRAIRAKTQEGVSENGSIVPGIIDAYATILSLDAAALPSTTNAPIRRAILDVNNDGTFDQLDIALFLERLLDPLSGEEIQPTERDFSRFDLNGDGFTGGSFNVQRFDLDRVGSTQFGATNYSTVTQPIEGRSVNFNEALLSDLEILCYYAYSALYTGSTSQRGTLLAGKCTEVTVSVQPGAVTLAPGATQQFGATVLGASNINVTWTASGGTITATGLFTAGNTAGTFTVRAISAADPGVFADATVTIASGTTLAGTITVSVKDTNLTVAWSAFVRMRIDTNPLTVVEATGTLSRLITLQGICGPLPFTQTVTFDRGRYSMAATAPSGNLSLGGTQVTTVANAQTGPLLDQNGNIVFDDEGNQITICLGTEVTTTTLTGDNLVAVRGRHVFANGRLVAIDFANVPGTTVVTGRLELQP